MSNRLHFRLLPIRVALVLGGLLLLPTAPTADAVLASPLAPGLRLTPLSAPGTGKAGFSLLSPIRTGINFTNRLAESRSLTNQIYLNGSGVAAGDVDGDGRCDLYFCGLDVPNTLYLNRGDWRFEDTTASAGVTCAGQASTGAALADLDGDGDLDLIVNALDHGPREFLNDGRGRFREVTETAGLGGPAGGMSLALADVDGDGDLDLYVVNYRLSTLRDEPEKRFRVGTTNGVYQLLSVDNRPASAPELAGRFTVDPVAGVLENGEADSLFLNDGQGRFTRVNWASGAFLDEEGRPARLPQDWGLSAMFHDLNGDGAPDLYVCNDFQSPDRIWLNNGRGGFRALPRVALRQTSLFSMGVDFADVDRDGLDDFFVADMLSRDHRRRQVQVMETKSVAAADPGATDRPQTSRNMLFRNRGDGTFAEVARFAGVEASEWSWCPAFLDVDLDGFEDLLITTGHGRDAQNADVAAEIEDAKRRQRLSFPEQLQLRRKFAPLNTPNVAFRNRGDFTFEDIGPDWGFDSRRISQGLALADLDNDGDLDVVINCLNEGCLLYRNDCARSRVAVRLRGVPPNTRGIGSRVCLSAPGLPPQCQEYISGGRYLSSDDAIRTFATGDAGNRVTIVVRWRSGRRSVVSDVPVNQLVEIDEAGAVADAEGVAPPPAPWFADVSTALRHQHVDEPFDDFGRQRLLPRRLSQLGPGVTWFDFNGDGWDDLIVGSGRGGRLSVFRNDTHGGFVPQRAAVLQSPAERDLTTILGWRPDSTGVFLLIGIANYEDGGTNGTAVRQLNLTTGTLDDSVPLNLSSTGPLALGDFDGDGELDLFVGGRAIPGRYPEAASSRLFRSRAGWLESDSGSSRSLAGTGLVSGAVFSDLDDDGQPELIVACEWGPLRLFRHRGGQLVEWDPPVKSPGDLGLGTVPLSRLTGGWNSVSTGDFDNDGRLDIVAGNWGRNTREQRFTNRPLELHFGDVGADGGTELIEAHFDSGLQSVVPAHDWATLSASFPALRDRYSNFTAFSTISLAEVLKSGLPPMHHVTELLLDSLVMLNRGDHFEARSLPFEAQVSPVFGLAVGDFDGDGHEDVFAAQNFFGVREAESRCDAGLGVWLRGDGKGGFVAVPARESGLAIEGEGRGAAVSDFDHDGRLDLAVGQNRGPTRLFRNLRSRPGLRVRLTGPEHNPQAIGARVRLVYRDGTKGPVHEVQGGGGYWSQDSAGIVLGLASEAAAVEVRWPGSTNRSVAIPSGAREVSLEWRP